VLLPGLIGVEDKLQHSTAKSAELIAKAMGSYPYYEVDNKLDKLLKGNISYPQYRASFLETAGLSDNYIDIFDHHCLQMFDSPYVYTEALLKNVATHCQLYLLSDHCEVWVEYITNKHSFFEYFTAIVWSYEIAATKKSSAPFTAILEKYQLDPASCLFVDDNLDNIANAREMGLQVLYFKNPASVEQVYAAIGIC